MAVRWSCAVIRDVQIPQGAVIGSNLNQSSVTSEGCGPCVEVFNKRCQWTEQEEHSSAPSVDNEISRLGTVIGHGVSKCLRC